MRHNDPKLIDALAAEYVLGTLRGPARARFERWRAEAWHIERRVQAWEDRLAPFALGLAPLQPSPQVWAQIERRIAADTVSRPAPNGQRFNWRALAAVLVLVAVLGGGFAAWRATHAPHYQPFAMIMNTTGQMAWQLEMDPKQGRMRMNAMPGAPVRPDRSFELWALPDSGGAPMSLGMLPEAGRQEHSLSIAQQQALAGASKVAVSMEPRGGSLTGAPTGPVLFVVERIKNV